MSKSSIPQAMLPNANECAAIRPLTIVAVHGVGDAVPGEICIELSKSLTKSNTEAVFSRADMVVNGNIYPQLRVDNIELDGTPVEAIVEVNWADVLRPSNGVWQVLKHIFQLIFGLRELSVQPRAAVHGETAARHHSPVLAKYFWCFMECIAWWASSLVVTVMLLHSCGSDHKHWLLTIAISSPIVIAAMACFLKCYSRDFLAGLAWVPVFILVSVVYVNGRSDWFERCVQWSTWGYVGCQLIASILLLLAFAEALFWLPYPTWPQRFARAGMLWIPFVIIAALGVANWIFSLMFATNTLSDIAYHEWQKIFLKALRYDLLWSEVGTMVSVVFTFVVVPAVGVAAYFSPRIRCWLSLPKDPGPTAHYVYQVLLTIGPFAMIAGASIFWITLYTGSTETTVPAKDFRVLEAYSWSAFRFVSLAPFFLPFVRNILDAAGDIIFHVQPSEDSPICSRRFTLPRVIAILEILRSDPNRQILLYAHSQGSVISWTVLRERPELADKLLSIGSPLSTLYAHFLGGEFGDALHNGIPQWNNVYRDGDYIGGSVIGCPDNKSIGDGDHVGYWGDSRMNSHLWP